jgi:hypothetical protein
VSSIKKISPFYAKVYEYLFSPEFLQAMSEITGIPNLHGDPTLFGGGTHENLNGQELDSHVDFNFQLKGGFHRRANLLLYLNKEWDPTWGGALELHSNPRRPEEDEVSEYNVTFNRAVIFETNEYSWHGFRRIQLPSSRRNLSRKCLSIYLYTKERPPEEIAGPHGTFYVQRPLDKEIKEGRVLSQAEVDEITRGYTRRDHQIEMYQKLEEKLGRQIEEIKAYLDEVTAAIKAPVLGWALQVGKSSGLFHDNWATTEVRLQLRCERSVDSVTVEGFIPANAVEQSRLFTIEIDGVPFEFQSEKNGSFSFTCPTKLERGATFALTLLCDSKFKTAEPGATDDLRPLSFLLTAIVVN